MTKPSKLDNKLNMSYFAGVVDSDGSVTITRRSYKKKDGTMAYYYYPEIKIGLKSKITVAHLWSIVHVGKVYHLSSGVCSLTIYGDEAVMLLKKIHKYMFNKKPQALLALEFAENQHMDGEYYFNRMKDLKKIAYAS